MKTTIIIDITITIEITITIQIIIVGIHKIYHKLILLLSLYLIFHLLLSYKINAANILLLKINPTISYCYVTCILRNILPTLN